MSDLESRILAIADGIDVDDDNSDRERDGDDGGYVKDSPGVVMSAVAGEAQSSNRKHGSSSERTTRTGPKGVIHDHKGAQREAARLRGQESERLNAMIANLSFQAAPTPGGAYGDRDKDEIEIDDDEQAFREYREQRMKEMQMQAGTAKAELSAPSFGYVEDLTPPAFVHVVEQSHKSTWIVIHLYENDVPACNRLNQTLDSLAARYPLVHFCRIQSTRAKPEGFDPIALPTLLIFKDGEQLHTILRVHDEVGGDLFRDEDVEEMLQKYVAL